MLRVLVALLLIANLGFFAWTQGWLDNVVGVRAIGDREPERLARQVRPDTVRILSAEAEAASTTAASLNAAPACLEAGPFTDAELPSAQAAAQAGLPGGSWATLSSVKPATWIVFMGPYPNREALSKKADEIKRRKLPFEELRDNAKLGLGLSLGRFDDKGNAARSLEQLTQQGVHTARVVELAPAASSHVLRAEKADAALVVQLGLLKTAALGKGFEACTKAPGG